MKTNNKKVFKAGRKVEPLPKRTSLISLRLTEEEKEAWEAKAEEAGLGNNLSKFIRYCVENRRIAPPAPAINSDIYGELGRIGNNINQIAYAINRAIKMGESITTDPIAEIEALKPLLQEVKQMLIGMPNQYNPDKNSESK
ncbi:plasmid mobilization protein [Rivularia sp. UHCC 0363]|uniref:plasmid mobilization protein n=1 Tax=Rivularia sp. UHCC 0363 TaxID=3110244 RepID=UPI002B1EE08F|nr:plasmid mobilization relaxosome protein MobC [Rivularia sp. UHCC 0363]MEA5599259.1 plasmid mobilization relaxosome protein MobC [Rivularia sp. UHCC 0363]